jgi:hypothetical protein
MGPVQAKAYTDLKRIEATDVERKARTKRVGRRNMIINSTFEISYLVLASAALGAILIGGLLAVMHVRRKYHPNLIGALLGALLCFLLLEALPALI